MPTNVVMPQMGESIAEGTIVRWIKKVGDKVDRDEPLFEISTDKVDAEIPSPAAGVVSEIRVKEGETVPVNSVVAVISSAVAQPSAAPAGASASAAKAAEPPRPSPQADGSTTASAPPTEQAPAASSGHYPGREDPPPPPKAAARAASAEAPSSKPAAPRAEPLSASFAEEAIRERS